MSTDLVPADNMSALNQLDPQAREVAVTRMLSEARSWLAHAVEATDPQSISTFKAQMATLVEATKQLNLSKGIQLDAQEIQRRAERGVGLAIRKGQAEGTVAARGDIGGYITRSSNVEDLVRPGDILPHGGDMFATYA